jgi:hypothetical protein
LDAHRILFQTPQMSDRHRPGPASPRVVRRPRAGPAAGPVAAAAARVVPPLARDPWALAVALSVLPLLFAARTAAPGEPFADDFLFLDFSVLRHNPSWWDGGGGAFYWRPLARQAWYGLLGPAMLAHPAAVAALQAFALAAAAVLAFRALRTVWPAPAAAAAAAFPLGMEAARVLVIWPSGAQDAGALVFLALALHAASRGRAWLAAAAGVAAALCKEVAAPLALLVALAPFPRPARARDRRLPVMGCAIAVWAAVRLAVERTAGGAGLAGIVNAAGAGLSPLARAADSAVGASRDAFGIAGGLPAAGAFAAVAAAAALVPIAWRLARPRSGAAGGWAWSAWGLAWFALGTAPLALLLPGWAPYRSVIPAAGLGVALVAPLAMGAPAWLVPLVAVRLVALLVAPQPLGRIPINADLAGNPMAYPRLALQQRVVRLVRGVLRKELPRVEPNARVVREFFPRMVGVAFAGDRSLHAWYGDTTSRWIRMADIRGPRAGRVDAMLEYEPERTPQFVGITPASVRAACDVFPRFDARRFDDAIRAIDRAESLQRDTSAALYFATLESWRAMALAQLSRLDEADAAAVRSLRWFGGNADARYVRASIAAMRGEWPRVRDLLKPQLVLYPDDARARELYAEAARHAGRGGR